MTSVGQNTPPPSPKAAAEDYGFPADDDDKGRVPTLVSGICEFRYLYWVPADGVDVPNHGWGFAFFWSWLTSIVSSSLAVNFSPATSTATVPFLGHKAATAIHVSPASASTVISPTFEVHAWPSPP